MRFKRIFYLGSIFVIFAALGSLSAGGAAWGQDPLTINYESLKMSCGGSQNLSASGGCAPYTWKLSGGGTLTPSGGDNTSATYEAASSNSGCVNNAMITVTDRCRNTAGIPIAVNCYLGTVTAFDTTEAANCGCHETVWCPQKTVRLNIRTRSYQCDNTIKFECVTVEPFGCSCFPNCSYYCSDDCDLPVWCGTRQCGGAGCNTVSDNRTEALKQDGCCPLNPLTGLPFDGGFSNCGDLGKDIGNCGCSCVANPTNAAIGNKYEEVLDLSISTPGIPLEFRRAYNSQITFDGPLSYGWTHSFDVILNVVQTDPSKRVRIWDSDGRRLYFSEAQDRNSSVR